MSTSFFIFSLPIIILLLFVIVSRSKYQNRSNAGAFFFENDNLVLNTGVPYPIPLDEIDHVELTYAKWRIEKAMSYGLSIKVVKKDGKSKTVLYNGYGTANLAYPADMKAALGDRGIPCILNEK